MLYNALSAQPSALRGRLIPDGVFPCVAAFQPFDSSFSSFYVGKYKSYFSDYQIFGQLFST